MAPPTSYGSVSTPSGAAVPDLTVPSPPYPPLTRPKRGLLNRVAILLCAAVIGTSLIAVSRSWSGYVPPNRDNSKYNELTMEGSSCSVGLPKHGISGYFNLPNSSLRYFYYFAAAESKSMSKAPLILWMSGGPGCSSLLAAMMENGPCKVERDEMGKARAHLAKFGWNNKANVVWVDQPAGVGFSYGPDDAVLSSHDEVADNMLSFLFRWQERFPDSHNGELFIFAESFGGHYAPAVGRRYFDAERLGKAPPGLKLKGIGVGNGLTNPGIQYKYASEFAYKNTYGIKAISKEQYDDMNENKLPSCLEKIHACNSVVGSETDCLDAFIFCNTQLDTPYVESGYNVYDVRSKGNYKDDLNAVSEFVSQTEVRAALDALNDKKFEACNMQVYAKFIGDWMREYDKAIPAMLDGGIDILIYAGDADFICNWMGNLAWVNAMEWKGKKAFNEAENQIFTLPNGEAGGEGKTSKIGHGGRLTFLRIYGAGHLAPRDQPYTTQQMLNRFIANGGIH
mmetsp:Transcript_2737/g.5707  ORF Transcript_2737/g.5707 Transcript_2737/m.5707 type:complete len:509 (+) Transcript_2737:174-1700(+)|eukprot:CAMPEP_0197553290 /NCGR_PEP_ID=MMETSP1320-20131121/8566_1 /TAXON_ID=91990 /ORGANISM="Bolidomonas sp., Strain RCC2347" /LENGTH=508 /DNA_ID=CAMNT_0043114023 /DNA_START=72 /DNA_END=1595 /DNA_ORIENTATION=+